MKTETGKLSAPNGSRALPARAHLVPKSSPDGLLLDPPSMSAIFLQLTLSSRISLRAITADELDTWVREVRSRRARCSTPFSARENLAPKVKVGDSEEHLEFSAEPNSVCHRRVFDSVIAHYRNVSVVAGRRLCNPICEQRIVTSPTAASSRSTPTRPQVHFSAHKRAIELLQGRSVFSRLT